MHHRFFRPGTACMSALIAMLLALSTGLLAENETNSPLQPPDLSHGRALYQSACDTCHSQNIHWRDKKRATSWATLINEVTRWQRNAGQRWEQADINDVAAYLNDRFYHLPCPNNGCVEKEASEPPRSGN